jgi:hypothetical protein
MITLERPTKVITPPGLGYSMPRPQNWAATGRIQANSVIALAALDCRNEHQASVFIYPHDFTLDEESIKKFNPDYVQVYGITNEKSFEGMPLDTLEKLFLAGASSLQSRGRHVYTPNRKQVIEHVYNTSHYANLELVIEKIIPQMLDSVHG